MISRKTALPSPHSPAKWRVFVLVVFLISLVLAWWAPKLLEHTAGSEPAARPQPIAYVGSKTCVACHADAYRAWSSSQHALALQEADERSVLGRFDGHSVRFGHSLTQPSRDGAAFQVQTEDAAGKPVTLPVSHVIGLAPLQQYLVTLPDGRRQVLGTGWDARDKQAGGQRWFHLFPGTGTTPGQPLHWAGIDQTWNYQCADCHSTNLRKRYDAKTDRYDTTWSEISVGCEACHGPGSAHVAWAQNKDAKLANFGLTARLDERKAVNWQANPTDTAQRSAPRETSREIEVCARCHSRRGQLTDEHRAGDPLLDAFRPALLTPGLFYADGQQRDEVYNYASFLQSRMHAAGVTCSDCHEPHGGKLRAIGNAVCARCHAPARFDAPAHHHHPAGSLGARCVACHAPTTTYMGVDLRHDHSFRLPRPDLSVKLGTPNACTSCHTKNTAQWAAESIRTWYPQPKPGFQGFAAIFAAIEGDDPAARVPAVELLRNRNTPAIVRASLLARLATHSALIDSSLVNAAYTALEDVDANVRNAAIAVVALAPVEARVYHLAPLLRDPLRLVRIDAARALAGDAEASLSLKQRQDFEAALSEYVAAQEFNADRPEALSNLGNLYTLRGEKTAARAAFDRALQRDRSFAGAWLGLALLLEQGSNPESAAKAYADARRHAPASADLAHAQGLWLIRQGRYREALGPLADAVRLAPKETRYRYVLAVALHDTGERGAALKQLRQLLKLQPSHADARAALAAYEATTESASRR